MADEPQTQIDVQQVIQNLANSVANLTTEAAVKDALISQLQTELAEARSAVTVEPVDFDIHDD